MKVSHDTTFTEAVRMAQALGKREDIRFGNKQLKMLPADNGMYVIESFSMLRGVADDKVALYDPVQYPYGRSDHVPFVQPVLRSPWQQASQVRPVLTRQGWFMTAADITLHHDEQGFITPRLTDTATEERFTAALADADIGCPDNLGRVVEVSLPVTERPTSHYHQFEYLWPRSRPLYLMPGTTERTAHVLVTAFELMHSYMAPLWQLRTGAGMLGSEDAYELIGRLNAQQPQTCTRETALRYLERTHQMHELSILGLKRPEALAATKATVKSRAKRKPVFSPV